MELGAGTPIAERYVVEGLVGRGGMAVVYRVRHVELDTAHALKVLTVPSQSVQRRLMVEGKAQGNLHHPNVVSVTDVVRVDGAPGLVMELVAGPSLEQLLTTGRLNLDQADDVARGILSGVEAAHLAGLVHRDLKPGNILLALTPTGMIPKITDFGLAKVLSDPTVDSATRSGATMGTPAYMAPEQIRDAKNVDERADVFSLGAILYELVTGVRAFGGADTFDIFERIAYGRYDPLPDDLPDRMVRAIEGALVVERDDRIASVAELRSIFVGDTRAATSTWDPMDLDRARSLVSHEDLPDSGDADFGATFGLTLGPGATLDEPEVVAVAPVWRPTPALEIAVGGVAVGVLGSLALALPMYLVMPARYAVSWYDVPGWFSGLGWAIGLAVVIGGGFWAGWRSGRWDAGFVQGGLAGFIIFTLIGGAAAGVEGSDPMLNALADPSATDQFSAFADGLISLLLQVYLAAWGFALGGAILGGVGATIGGIAADRKPERLDPARLRIFGSLGLVGLAVSGGASLLAAAVTVQLQAILSETLGDQIGAGTLLAAVVSVPLLSAGLLMVASYAGTWLGIVQHLRIPAPMVRREAYFMALASAVLAFGPVAAMFFMPGATQIASFPPFVVIVVLGSGLATVGSVLWLRRRGPLVPVPLDYRDGVAWGIMGGVLFVGMLFSAIGSASIALINLIFPGMGVINGNLTEPVPYALSQGISDVYATHLWGGLLMAVLIAVAIVVSVPIIWIFNRHIAVVDSVSSEA